jgi:hypothetical protein
MSTASAPVCSQQRDFEHVIGREQRAVAPGPAEAGGRPAPAIRPEHRLGDDERADGQLRRQRAADAGRHDGRGRRERAPARLQLAGADTDGDDLERPAGEMGPGAAGGGGEAQMTREGPRFEIDAREDQQAGHARPLSYPMLPWPPAVAGATRRTSCPPPCPCR